MKMELPITSSRQSKFVGAAAMILITILPLVTSYDGAYAYEAYPSDYLSTGAFLERVRKNGMDDLKLIDFMFVSCVGLLVIEILNFIVKGAGRALNLKQIPVRGKHLDDLDSKDVTFIVLNKMATIPFVYFLMKYLLYEPNVIWSLQSVSFTNTLLPLPPFFIIYDFFYTIVHWAGHIQPVYKYIHKHHHRQKAPSRGDLDAVNVHPVELFLGEYDHILAMYIYCNLLDMEMHVLAIAIIFILAIILTGLNHTRFDSTVKVMGVTVYDSKGHDLHHRIPDSNFGEYIHFWDRIFGTFRAYDPNDRVNPSNQLDPKTGKSFNHGKLTAK